ncbi:MAG: hypothetical protein ACXVA9_05615 [Bdellovibrionales bacterium]
MAKVTTKSSAKSKKSAGTELDAGAEPIWENDEMLTASPKQFSESLKRISEQAKDWEEMRRPQREFPPAPTQEATRARTASRGNSNWPKIGTVTGIVLIIFLALHSVLMTWQTITLTKSMDQLNLSLGLLKDKVEVWSDAETPAQR